MISYVATGTTRDLLLPNLHIDENHINAIGDNTDTEGAIQVAGVDGGTINRNYINDIAGSVGGINVADGSNYEVADNHIEDITTGASLFDGGGILCAGSDFSIVRNFIKDAIGRGDIATLNGFDLPHGS